MRRAARVDDNHAEILDAVRSLGAMVVDTSAVGSGFPDAIIGWRGRLIWIEIKDGAKRPSARKLTPSQCVFHAEWARINCPVHVVETVSDALRLLGAREGA